MADLSANLKEVQDRIAEAAKLSGRDAPQVKLVAVTKTVELDVVKNLYDLGVRDFGENRVQPATKKVAEFAPEDVNWHFIGHLQRNKAKQVFDKFSLFHGAESLKLVEVFSRLATEKNITVPLCVEVNIAGEESKYGIRPDEAREFVETAASLDGIDVRGLMTMAPFSATENEIRKVFAGLRVLREKLQKETGCKLPELSMGMSNDFEIAVQEGATMVRVGSALYK